MGVFLVGCPSRFKEPPGILPTAWFFCWCSTVSGKKSMPGFFSLVERTNVPPYVASISAILLGGVVVILVGPVFPRAGGVETVAPVVSGVVVVSVPPGSSSSL